MAKFDVVIQEVIHYFQEVEANSPEEARQIVSDQMKSPDWEDPRHSDVQGQRIIRVNRMD